MQDSANQISLTIKYYLFWNEKEGSRNLRHRTSKNNNKHFPLSLYQHKDSLGLVECNYNLPAVVQGDVCDTDQDPEKINTDYNQCLSFLGLHY